MKSLNEFLEYELLSEAYQIIEMNEDDKILIPRFTPKKTTHRVFKDWPTSKTFDYDQRMIYDSIQWGMILDITYEKNGIKTKRTIQPMVLGRNKDGKDLIRAFHLSGNSESMGSDTKKVWRLFKPENIIDMKFSGSFFRTSPDNYKADDSAMKGGIITAANLELIRTNQENLLVEAIQLNIIDPDSLD